MALFATDSAEGQALNPTWHGEWRKQSANIADADSPALRITGGTPTRLVTGSQVCAPTPIAACAWRAPTAVRQTTDFWR